MATPDGDRGGDGGDRAGVHGRRSVYSTTTGVQVAFTVSGVGHSGADAGADRRDGFVRRYSFTPATGAFTYTPVPDDIGTQTFTFTASNAAGVVTQAVSVIVSDLPATVPVFGANPGPWARRRAWRGRSR